MVTITFLSRVGGKTITVIGDCEKYQAFAEWFVYGDENVVSNINLFNDGLLLLDLTYKFYLATHELYSTNYLLLGVSYICDDCTMIRRLKVS